MLNRVWLLFGMATVVAGAILGIAGGPEGDAYSALGFSIFAIGVAVIGCENLPGLVAGARIARRTFWGRPMFDSQLIAYVVLLLSLLSLMYSLGR